MQDDINATITKHIGLIFNQLKKFNLAKDPEAESIGYEALYNAILTYDQSKNVQFSTYASVCIYNALGSYVRTQNKQRQLEVISYNNVAYSEDGTDHEFVDFLSTPSDVEQDFMRKELHGIVREEFQKQYDTLTNEKHKTIITLWRNSEFEASMVSIAKQAGVSQPYVSQVINSFKFNLRKRLEEHYYD